MNTDLSVPDASTYWHKTIFHKELSQRCNGLKAMQSMMMMMKMKLVVIYLPWSALLSSSSVVDVSSSLSSLLLPPAACCWAESRLTTPSLIGTVWWNLA